MATAVETVKNFVEALKNYSQESGKVGLTALDDAVRRSSIFENLDDATSTLKSLLQDETIGDTDTRLQKATGMVLGAQDNYTADTGAISGANAGGDTVKDAQSIVPEDGDLTTATLPEPGTTTPITYTGNDGKSFTFYVKWPESFSSFVDFRDGSHAIPDRVADVNYHTDLNTIDDSETYPMGGYELPVYRLMKQSIPTAVKALNTYWLRESAKLNYDSLGLALDGQTVEIAFCLGGSYDNFLALTIGDRGDSRPSNHILLTISSLWYAALNETDPNGNRNITSSSIADLTNDYMDRTIAHEMVHVAMFANGTEKAALPQFFTEGIAEVVQGVDDYYSFKTPQVVELVNDSSALSSALSLAEGTGADYSYVAGDMFMRFIGQQGLTTAQFVGDSAQAETFSYDTSNAVVTNYDEDDTVIYTKPLNQAISFLSPDDLEIYAVNNEDFYQTQALILRDVRGKLVTMDDGTGAKMRAYMLPSANEIDGRNINGGADYQILLGSNYENDVIRAGNSGSILWGGIKGDDELFGGAGKDIFRYETNDGLFGGHDSFNDVESQDVIQLSLSLDKISGAQLSDNGVYMTFSNGGSLTINGTPATFTVVDGNDSTNYRADYQAKTFTKE